MIRTPSGLRFAAVMAALDGVYHRVHARLLERRTRGRIDVADPELDWIARVARMEAHEAVAQAHDAGVAAGRAAVRAELGLDPEHAAGPDDETKRLAPCPLDSATRCPVPARAPTLPYGRKP